MASIAIPRSNTGVMLSRKQRDVTSSGATMSRYALLTRHEVALPASSSAGPRDQIIVTLDAGLTEGSIPEWVRPTAEAFADILELGSGWNSYSAQPVDPRAVETAGSLLACIMAPSTPTPVIVPTVRGGLQLEWHKNGLDIEISVNPSRPITVYAIDNRSGQEWEGEWSPDDTTLSSWIQKL